MVLKVFRWSPGFPERIQRFWVPAREGMTVLDALVDAQRRLDPTLAFRYACRVGMCGSCGMVINGRERWACRTLLAGLGTRIVTVRPLYHFPLIRDLVVDLAPLAEQTARVGGVFVPKEGEATFAPIGGDAPERRRIDPAIECIGCGLCMSACTMVANDARFPGPAALNRLFTVVSDSRDAGHADRAAVLLSEDTLLRCHSQANCTDVCPMEISPTESILALRRRAVRALFASNPLPAGERAG
jgi:succinate dehydrogenase/fumarate reductase iron-sulfur protein